MCSLAKFSTASAFVAALVVAGNASHAFADWTISGIGPKSGQPFAIVVGPGHISYNGAGPFGKDIQIDWTRSQTSAGQPFPIFGGGAVSPVPVYGGVTPSPVFGGGTSMPAPSPTYPGSPVVYPMYSSKVPATSGIQPARILSR